MITKIDLEVNNMELTWKQVKKDIKSISPESKETMEEIEMLASIITTMVDKRHELGISQRDLASSCGLPHSSVARIEAGTVKPNIDTLLRIMKPLGLTLSVTPLR